MNKVVIFLLLSSVNQITVTSMKNEEGELIAGTIFKTVFQMFLECFEYRMPNMHYDADDIKKFVNYPSKTTVGFAPKFTNNRKFFANLISTTAFKDMLQRDQDKIALSVIAKSKFCESSVLDKALLNDFYDREVDQNKV